jgi:hypothetical protein
MIFLNMERENVQNKCVYELTDDDIKNATNVFVIDSMHNEPIVNYVKSVDFSNILSEKSKDLFKNKNFKLLVIDNKEGSYYHEKTFFDGTKRLYDDLKIQDNSNILYNQFI